MSGIFNLFFNHTDTLYGTCVDMVVFLAMISLVVYLIKLVLSFGRGGRL